MRKGGNRETNNTEERERTAAKPCQSGLNPMDFSPADFSPNALHGFAPAKILAGITKASCGRN